MLDEDDLSTSRRVSLFRNGRNQAVRIPRDMELPGDAAILRKEGGRLILEPAAPADLLALLDALEPIEDAFPEIEDAPPEPADLQSVHLLDTDILSDLMRRPQGPMLATRKAREFWPVEALATQDWLADGSAADASRLAVAAPP